MCVLDMCHSLWGQQSPRKGPSQRQTHLKYLMTLDRECRCLCKCKAVLLVQGALHWKWPHQLESGQIAILLPAWTYVLFLIPLVLHPPEAGSCLSAPCSSLRNHTSLGLSSFGRGCCQVNMVCFQGAACHPSRPLASARDFAAFCTLLCESSTY